MRLYLVPVSQLKHGRHLVLRRLARVRLDHLRCSTMCSCPSIAACRSRRCATPLARLEGQYQSDLPHAVYRRAFLCAARPGARPRARRLCRFRAMDAAALSDLHAAQHRPARAGAAEGRGDRRADRCRRASGAARARHRAQGLYRHDDARRARCCAAISPTPCACCAKPWKR